MEKINPVTENFIQDIIHSPERIVDFLGCKIKILPGVFPVDSEFSFSTEITAEMIPHNAGKVLDVGTGTGVQAIIAAKRGAERVLAIDVDKKSLMCARENVDLNDVAGTVEIIESNLFENVSERFDLMISQLPFADVSYESPVGGFLFDPGFNIHKRFLKDAKRYLEEGGRIMIPSGDIANEKRLLELIEENGYVVVDLKAIKRNGLTWKIYTLAVA